MDGVYRDGFDFVFDPKACEVCPGYCCCGETGHVWVSPLEMEGIRMFLQENPVDFIEKYFFRINGRLSCQERVTEAGLACVFFQGEEKKCAIYAVRPSACRSYPFWSYFKENPDLLLKECPGVKRLSLEK